MAISASLLPPAVNTGLYWAMAMMSYGFEDKLVDDGVQGISMIETKVGTLTQQTFVSHGYQMTHCVQGFKFEYAEHGDIPLELFWRGMISLTLTAVNILCIIIVGVLMLLVKQVTQNKLPRDRLITYLIIAK